MSNTFNGGFITVTKTGATVTTAATTARTTIPTDAAGNLPRYVRIAATAESYVKLGDGTVTATSNDMLIQPADAAIVAVNGATNIAYIQGGAAAKVNIVPLENV